MEDYEYIMAKCRKHHFTGWDENELRSCQEVLPSLTREELLRLYGSRWVDGSLKKTVFKVLFADKVGKREERIMKLPTDELILEFKDKKCGNIALIRKEMRNRYKANLNGDRTKIASVFNMSLKSDRQWVMSQVRKAEHEVAREHESYWKTVWKK